VAGPGRWMMRKRANSPGREVQVARADRGVLVVEREGGSSLGWFLAGGLLGAGLALLFAPHSGDKTRRMVGRKLARMRDAAEAALDDVREALAPEEPAPRSVADHDVADEDSAAAPGTSAAREAEAHQRGPGSARRELEQRLAEVRARRQRALADEDEEPVA